MPNPQFLYRATGRRAFVRQGPISYTRFLNDFERLTQAADDAKRLCRWRPETCQENRSLILASTVVDPLESYIRHYRTTIRQSRVNRSPDRSAKESGIHAAYNQINLVAKRGLRAGPSLLD